MSLASLRIAATALAIIEDGLKGGGTLNVPALEAFNAGLNNLASVGMEPTPNQEQAFSNLTEMLIDAAPVEAAGDDAGEAEAGPSEASSEAGAEAGGSQAIADSAPATDAAPAEEAPTEEPAAEKPAKA